MSTPARRAEAVADFLRYAEAERRLSVHTVDAYRRDQQIVYAPGQRKVRERLVAAAAEPLDQVHVVQLA